jgi:hypothetical protein
MARAKLNESRRLFLEVSNQMASRARLALGCFSQGWHQACNQGVGNGPEGCDPGNSNQGDKSRSNDELGGTPGDPGRKGGNGK